jgi:hypothetical protein
MKLNIWQFLTITFATIYALGDAFGFDYQARMGSAVCVTLVIAYLNNAHGQIIGWFKK